MPGGMPLFTLVGIAGEDDIDAPDLTAPTASAGQQPAPRKNGRLNGGQGPSTQPFRGRGGRPAKGTLGPRPATTERKVIVLQADLYAREAREERRLVRDLLRQSRALVKALTGSPANWRTIASYRERDAAAAW